MRLWGGSIFSGEGVTSLTLGQRVGIPWLGHTCGRCPYCLSGRENLCDAPSFTGYTRDGGFATAVIADAHFVFALGEGGEDASLAPLLCAGLIGWRSLVMAGSARTLGLYGFGAAAHIIAQVARHQGKSVFAFTSPGDQATQQFARALGAVWAGGSDEVAPEKLDAAIIYAPVGALVPIALGSVRKGGRVVCAGIHMTDIPAFPYDLLWEEREIDLGRQSDPPGWRGVPGPRRAHRDQDQDNAIPASGRQSRPGRSQGRRLRWRGGSHPLS